jgi:large subunit ribosomal protein L10
MSAEDPVAPAKVLVAFAKDHQKLELKVGALDGKLLDLADIKALAELPSREVLLAQMLAGLNAVPTGLVRTLNAIPTQLLNALTAIKDQKEQAAA